MSQFSLDDIEKLAQELGRDIKSEEDLENIASVFQKKLLETALNAELDDHLGYSKHESKGRNSGNSRNGKSKKILKSKNSQFELDVPRDRDGSFSPQIVRKNQTRFSGLDRKILYLYATGCTTREISQQLKEIYDVDVSPTLISNVTEAIIQDVIEWQNRPLEPVYPIVYLDCIVVKVRQDKRVINKSIYLALAIDLQGQKELLGLWISENEGAKFWLNVLTELKNRGVHDILIACVDGLSGFPQAIETVYPNTRIQLCVVHMVRNSMKYVVWKDYKAVTQDLKRIYQSVTEAQARQALDDFSSKWDDKYPQVSKIWYRHWPHLITLFDYPDEIRRAIYTTNAVESLNSVIRKVIKKRKIFPHDDSAMKIVYLAVQQASKKWTMSIRNWKAALNRFMIEFEDRLIDYV